MMLKVERKDENPFQLPMIIINSFVSIFYTFSQKKKKIWLFSSFVNEYQSVSFVER